MENKIMRRGAVLFITVSMCAAPVLASAQTTDASSTVFALRTQIQSLLNQVYSLRTQIAQITGVAEPDNGASPADAATSTQPTPPVPPTDRPCPALIRNLQVGAQGTDVKELQQFLAQDPSIFTGTATGFFGLKTAQAVQRFQSMNGIATTSTGVVGPRTRDFLRGRCGADNMMGTSTQSWISGSTTLPRNGDDQKMPPIPDIRVGSTTLPTLIHDIRLSTSTMQRIWEVASSTLGGMHREDWRTGSTTPQGQVPPLLQPNH